MPVLGAVMTSVPFERSRTPERKRNRLVADGRDGTVGMSGSLSESHQLRTFRYCQRQTTTIGLSSYA
jgi:hypothetical protein